LFDHSENIITKVYIHFFNGNVSSGQLLSVDCILTASFVSLKAMRRAVTFSTVAVELSGQCIAHIINTVPTAKSHAMRNTLFNDFQ
jgi:hypothetical protein